MEEKIPAETKSLLCLIERAPDSSGRRTIKVLASGDSAQVRRRSWRTTLKPEVLESSDRDGLAALMDDLESGVVQSREMPYQGRDSLWVYRPITENTRDYTAGLILITPEEDIVRPAVEAEEGLEDLFTELTDITRWAIVGTILLVTALAFAFSRTVTKPLEALAQGAQRLAAGDFYAQLEIQSQDEFGEMCRVFNSVGPRSHGTL